MNKAFLKVENLVGVQTFIDIDAIVAIRDWAIEGQRCAQVIYMAGKIEMFAEADATAAEVWDQISHLRADAQRVEDAR